MMTVKMTVLDFQPAIQHESSSSCAVALSNSSQSARNTTTQLNHSTTGIKLTTGQLRETVRLQLPFQISEVPLKANNVCLLLLWKKKATKHC